jgi:hypothetical protein
MRPRVTVVFRGPRKLRCKMRRSRYGGFYRTFTPRRSPASERAPVPSVSYADVQREICRHWHATGEFLRFVDSKQRAWLMYDANSTSGFRYEYAIGLSQAFARVLAPRSHSRMAICRRI